MVFELCKGIPITSQSTSSGIVSISNHLHPTSLMPHLYQGLPPACDLMKPNQNFSLDGDMSQLPNLGTKLGLILPNPAPDVTPTTDLVNATTTNYGSSQGTLLIKIQSLNLIVYFLHYLKVKLKSI